MDQPSSPDQLRFVASLVQARLQKVISEEKQRWSEIDERLCLPIEQLEKMVAGGGKRLRAGFCFWSWYGKQTVVNPGFSLPANLQEVGNSDIEGLDRIVDVCAAIEMLHTFALVHDDVMDNSAVRRGQPTVHFDQRNRMVADRWRGEPRRFGESVAILVGNMAHVYADSLIGGGEVKNIWDEMRIEINLGQYLDVRSSAANEVDSETARRVAWYKSALYSVVKPLQLGLAVGDESPSESMSEAIGNFGAPVGRAFQLRDDLLGVFGDPHQLGKPVGDDLREGKPTELLAFARQKANPAQFEILETVGGSLTDSDLREIVQVLRGTGADRYIEQEIKSLVAEAEAAIVEMPFSSTAKNALLSLARYVAFRSI